MRRRFRGAVLGALTLGAVLGSVTVVSVLAPSRAAAESNPFGRLSMNANRSLPPESSPGATAGPARQQLNISPI